MFGSAQKGIKHWILNQFLLVNSEMWIRTAIKLPHDLGVCQKTVGNSAGDFHGGGERKTQTSWIRTAIKSPTTPCIWWKSLMSPWETITLRIGLKTNQVPNPDDHYTAKKTQEWHCIYRQMQYIISNGLSCNKMDVKFLGITLQVYLIMTKYFILISM